MIEDQVVRMLESLGVPYELMQIDPAFADTAACCEKYGLPLDSAGNTIVVASKKEPRKFGACVVKATTRLDVNHAVRALLGTSKVSFATAEETKALTGMMIGGVTVFALPPDLPIYVDDKLMAREWVILGSGSRSSKIRIAPEVFRRIPNATIVPGLAVDIPRAAVAAEKGPSASLAASHLDPFEQPVLRVLGTLTQRLQAVTPALGGLGSSGAGGNARGSGRAPGP